MSNFWFPLLILVGAAVVSISAAAATKTQKPKHPLVERSSILGFWSFLVATAFYIAAAVTLFQERTILAASLALVGLLGCAIGCGTTRKSA
ncbi:hypothetical protein [Corynebacterium sp. H127]|uniref:hypothetical protein n=1 Tax=Corynebacterium sp. H127 TaxID=3133418 RepID=UPI0030DC8D67